MSATPQPVVSVAICTHDRAPSLARTLESVAGLRDPGVPWELIVVDNASADRTPEVVAAFAARHALRAVREPVPGLSRARNRALAASRGRLLAFTDDDVTLDPGWLAAYAGAFARHPEAGYFGGPIRPEWPDGRPRWVRDEALPLIAGLLGHYDLGAAEHAYAGAELHPYGANFALRRELWEQVGGFDPALGVRGTAPGRGEEADYIARARAAGWSGWYVPGASCGHRVQPSHLTPAFLYRHGVQKGMALARSGQDPQRRGRGRAGELLIALRGLAQLARGRGDRWRQCLIAMGVERGLRQEGR